MLGEGAEHAALSFARTGGGGSVVVIIVRASGSAALLQLEAVRVPHEGAAVFDDAVCTLQKLALLQPIMPGEVSFLLV